MHLTQVGHFFHVNPDVKYLTQVRRLINYNNLQNIWDKLYFSHEIEHFAKIFQDFFASTEKILFRLEDWALGNNSMMLCQFPDISWFCKMVSFNPNKAQLFESSQLRVGRGWGGGGSNWALHISRGANPISL